MKSCVYPGSFDPFTLGHLDVVKRAASMFDVVYILVGKNVSKTSLFTVDKRISLIKSNVKDIPNVQVLTFDGLLVDVAYELNATAVIKGIRNPQDFDYEKLLHEIGMTQQRGIETVTIFSKKELSHISSSAAKEICKNYGLLDEYVPLNVKQSMECTLLNKKIVGVTGSIGMGKSYLINSLKELKLEKYGLYTPDFREVVHENGGKLSFFHIDLDKISHDILHTRTENVYLELRRNVIKTFNLSCDILNNFNRKQLGEIVFNDPTALAELNRMMRQPILTRIRQELAKISPSIPIVLVDGAILAEANFLPIVNNNIILVHANKQIQESRLKNRGMSIEQINKRVESQWNTSLKLEKISKSIKTHDFGNLLMIDTSNETDNDKNLRSVVRFIKNC